MAKIVECVPNISEGRDLAIVEKVVDEVRNTLGVALLDYSSDASHNRSVITFTGSPEGVMEAAVKIAKKAAELIDLTKHTGEHPRMGAVDVIPFIPIKEISVEECMELSKAVGKRVYEEAGIPVFLYEASASAPHRENLAAIRKGQFEGMAEKVKDPQWTPDFGGAKIHPTAGVVAVGTRMPLVAFNINLSTSDVSIASDIAKIIRRSSGGLDCVKAMGVLLEDRNVAQVSINMTNFKKTPLYRVVEFVRFEAARYGVHVIGTEIVGLAPMRALIDSAEYYLQIEKFDADKQVLENFLL
ncbi:MAG TPA: glutamate formimidoyltransferase [Clostridia bacterium]|nr:glutamate formimidoyltransferase [Clostridia bacterium]